MIADFFRPLLAHTERRAEQRLSKARATYEAAVARRDTRAMNATWPVLHEALNAKLRAEVRRG